MCAWVGCGGEMCVGKVGVGDVGVGGVVRVMEAELEIADQLFTARQNQQFKQ